MRFLYGVLFILLAMCFCGCGDKTSDQKQYPNNGEMFLESTAKNSPQVKEAEQMLKRNQQKTQNELDKAIKDMK